MTGRLEVICGPMFSGKSEELMRRLRREQIAGRKVILVKSSIDDRYSLDQVVSHNGSSMDAIACSVEDLLHIIEDYNVVGIDEVQFYPESVVSVVNTAVADGRKVIVAGLDATFRREPFGFMPQLAAMAEQIDKYNAICHSCGEDAAFTQRLVDGKPAPFSGPTILVDGLDSYEARCRSCYQSVE